MIRLIDGHNSVELDKDDMDVIFGAVEDYYDNYQSAKKTLDKLRTVYHIKGSES